jgi:hypothetical protein
MKDAFLFMQEYEEYLDDLSYKEAWLVVKSAFIHERNGREDEYPKLSKAAAAIFKMIRKDLDRHRKNYEETCEKNRENANKRWNKSKPSVGSQNGSSPSGSKDGSSPSKKDGTADQSVKTGAEKNKGSALEKSKGSRRSDAPEKKPDDHVSNGANDGFSLLDNANACDRISSDAKNADNDLELDLDKDLEKHKEIGAIAPKEKARAHYLQNGVANEKYLEWLEYKKRIGAPLVTKAQINASIERLKSYSLDASGNFDPNKAVKVIKQSIREKWQNFYPLDEPRARSGTRTAFGNGSGKTVAFNNFGQRTYSAGEIAAIEMAARG